MAKNRIRSPRDHAGAVYLADAGACGGTEKQDTGGITEKDMLTLAVFMQNALWGLLRMVCRKFLFISAGLCRPAGTDGFGGLRVCHFDGAVLKKICRDTLVLL